MGYVQQLQWAEDITQDVFIAVYQSINEFNERSSLNTWIYRITVNKCLDALRAQKRQKRFAFLTSLFHKDTGLLLYDLGHFDHPGILVEKKDDARFLFEALQGLPENQKTSFILFQIEGMSQKEIAEVMNITDKAVESLMQRAKANLRKKLTSLYVK